MDQFRIVTRSAFLPHTDITCATTIAHQRTLKQNANVTRADVIREFLESALGDPAALAAVVAMPKKEETRRGNDIYALLVYLPEQFDQAVSKLAGDTGHSKSDVIAKLLSDRLDAEIPERVAKRARQAEWDKRGPHIDPNPATLMYG